MSFELEVIKGSVEMERAEDGLGWRLRLDDDELLAVPDAGDPQRFVLTRAGQAHTVYAVGAKDGVWVWHDGTARLVRERRAGTRSAGGESEAGEVTPPMPGVVVRVLCEPGQSVKKGQDLVAISAMKMESVLKAPRAGTVAAVRAVVGEQVKPGDVLVEFEPEADAADAKGGSDE